MTMKRKFKQAVAKKQLWEKNFHKVSPKWPNHAKHYGGMQYYVNSLGEDYLHCCSKIKNSVANVV